MFDKLTTEILQSGPLGIALAISLIFLSGTVYVCRLLYNDLKKANEVRAGMIRECAAAMASATAAIQALEKTVIMFATRSSAGDSK